MVPSPRHITAGSEHGSVCHGWANAPHVARATPLACRLDDREEAFPPRSQRMERRAWYEPDGDCPWVRVDDAGQRFY